MITISISKTELLQKLQAASKIISSKPVTPIMSCFLFHAHDNKLTITTADSSGRIVLNVENATFSEEISICYESIMLLDALRTLPEQPLVFEINPETLDTKIKYQGGKFQMPGKSPSLFPEQKTISKGDKIEMSANQFLNGIEKVSFCVANDDLRPILNAVFVEIKDGSLNFVSSDSHKMGVLSYSNAPDGVSSLSFALPQKIAGIIKNILPNDETIIQLNIGPSNVTIEFDNGFITAQLLEGRFPNYRSVIPQNNNKKVIVSVHDLKSALSRVMVFTNKSSLLVKFNLNNNELVLTGQDIDFSLNAEERLLCESTDSITIGFKGSFLSEILSAINSDRIVMSFSDPTRAALIDPETNKEGQSLTYLLMPMMINDYGNNK